MNTDYLLDHNGPVFSEPHSWLPEMVNEAVEHKRQLINYGGGTIHVKDHNEFTYPLRPALTMVPELAGMLLIKERWDFPEDIIPNLLISTKSPEGNKNKDEYHISSFKEIINTALISNRYTSYGNRAAIEIEYLVDLSILNEVDTIFHYNTNLMFSSLEPAATPVHPHSSLGKESIYRSGHELMARGRGYFFHLEIIDNDSEELRPKYITRDKEILIVTPERDRNRENGIYVRENRNGKAKGVVHFGFDNFSFGGMRIFDSGVDANEYISKEDNEIDRIKRDHDKELMELKNLEVKTKKELEQAKANSLQSQKELEELKRQNAEKELADNELLRQREKETSEIQHEQKREESSWKRNLTIATAIVGGLAIIKKIFF